MGNCIFGLGLLLAEGGAADAPAAPQGGGPPFMLMGLVFIGFLFYLMIIVPERRKQKAFRDQIAAVKKNDRVVTIGGLYGTVANINRDADKVTLKVDDNTKLDFTLGAISRIVSAENPSDKDKPAQ